MAKATITFSIDVEAAGPIPGPWWMCSFGVCRTDDPERGIRRILEPMVIPGVSAKDDPAAMRVVSQGLKDVVWHDAASDDDNLRRVRAHFERHGVAPATALMELGDWMRAEAAGNRMVLVGSPVTFDFLWIYWYWWWFLREMPPFGYSGLDIRSYFMGMHGVGFLGTGKERYLKRYPNTYAHTHDPLDDARQQAAIWRDMVAERMRTNEG